MSECLRERDKSGASWAGARGARVRGVPEGCGLYLGYGNWLTASMESSSLMHSNDMILAGLLAYAVRIGFGHLIRSMSLYGGVVWG